LEYSLEGVSYDELDTRALVSDNSHFSRRAASVRMTTDNHLKATRAHFVFRDHVFKIF
jgi:hypothetical protein